MTYCQVLHLGVYQRGVGKWKVQGESLEVRKTMYVIISLLCTLLPTLVANNIIPLYLWSSRTNVSSLYHNHIHRSTLWALCCPLSCKQPTVQGCKLLFLIKAFIVGEKCLLLFTIFQSVIGWYLPLLPTGEKRPGFPHPGIEYPV